MSEVLPIWILNVDSGCCLCSHIQIPRYKGFIKASAGQEEPPGPQVKHRCGTANTSPSQLHHAASSSDRKVAQIVFI